MLRRCAVNLSATLALCVGGLSPAFAGDVTVFVAASLVDVIDDLAAGFEKSTGHEVDVVPGASSTLARQIVTGAPADLFISADRANVDIVATNIGAEVHDLFGNRLAVVAPDSFEGTVTLDNLAEILGDGRLAVGDPAHVPAGIYAQQALENAGVWDAVKDRLAPAGDVRGAVAFVAQDATPFGIVYQTDAVVPGVKIVLEIDPALHAPIRYWGLVVDTDAVTALMFLSYIGSSEGQGLLADAGFEAVVSSNE